MTDQTTTVENTNDAGEAGKSAVTETDTTVAKDTQLLAGGEVETADDTKTQDTDNGDGKATDEAVKKDDDTDTDKGSKDAEQVEYEDFTVPDGMQIDEAALAEFKPIAQELGLNQEGAQKVVDMYAKMQAANAEAWTQQVESWANETKADKEMTGGDGFDTNLKTAQAAIREVFPDQTERQAFLDLISHTGLANNSLMAKFCLRVGKQVVDDKIVKGGDATSGPRSIADRMYPTN